MGIRLVVKNSEGDTPICDGCEGSLDQLVDCRQRTVELKKLGLGVYPEIITARRDCVREGMNRLMTQIGASVTATGQGKRMIIEVEEV